MQQTHFKPLSEIFTSAQFDKILVDNKVGKNYLGEMAVQLRKKVASFKAIRERLVLSSNADLAFSVGADKMLADKELKKKKEIDKIEAEWSKAHLKGHYEGKGWCERCAGRHLNKRAIQDEASLPIC